MLFPLPHPLLLLSSPPSPSLVRIKLNLSLYRISFKAFEEEKGKGGRALEEGALGDSEQGQEGKEGRGQRETEWEGALLTKLFLHFGRWMGLTEEENRRKECFQECRGDYKGFAFPVLTVGLSCQ